MLLKDWLVKDSLMLKLKFLADEDVDARLVKFLSNEDVDIKFAPKGIRNSKLYSLACEEQRVLLSLDKDFLNTSLFPPLQLPAIVVIRIHLLNISEVESLLLNFIKEFSDKFNGKTLVLRREGIATAD